MRPRATCELDFRYHSTPLVTVARKASGQRTETTWTFLTNHAHVLLCLAADPAQRLRDVAERVGITERAVQRIVADLEAAGYITRSKSGRRNAYKVHRDRPLRHPIESHRGVSALIGLANGARQS